MDKTALLASLGVSLAKAGGKAIFGGLKKIGPKKIFGGVVGTAGLSSTIAGQTRNMQQSLVNKPGLLPNSSPIRNRGRIY